MFREAPDLEVCFCQQSKGEENKDSKVQKPGSDHGCRGIKLDYQQPAAPAHQRWMLNCEYNTKELVLYVQEISE